MREHIVSSFDQELTEIDRLIRRMAELSASMIEAATASLLNADTAAAQRVISDDVIMDERQRELDDRAITLIAKRQPMAQDLRSVVAAIRMAADLERIGDLAKNVAKRVGAVGQAASPKALSHSLDTMTVMVVAQLRGITRAYVERDPDTLVTLRAEDRNIDVQYTAIFRELLTYMMEDPRHITACTHLLFCAKNLERIGDHATNIAENAYYVITGAQLPLQRPKTDETSHPAIGA